MKKTKNTTKFLITILFLNLVSFICMVFTNDESKPANLHTDSTNIKDSVSYEGSDDGNGTEIPNYIPETNNIENSLETDDIVNNEVNAKVPKPITERTIYNKNNSDANRFLQYLNDETPLYLKDGSYVYYSERIEHTSGEQFYIFDMDGDGEKEFLYYYHPDADIIKYDYSSDSFVLWLETNYWTKPLTTLQMYYAYYYASGTHTAYERYIFDEFSNLISTEYYSLGVTLDTEGRDQMHYYIGDEEVTEEQWNISARPFLELNENAPNSLTYDDLLLY